MDSDFIANILIQCHKIKGSREICFYQLNFCCQNLSNEASDPQFSEHTLPQMELHWKCSVSLPYSVQSLKELPMQAWQHFSIEA